MPCGPFSKMALGWIPVSHPSRECWVVLFDSSIHKGLLIFRWSIASLPLGYRLCCRTGRGWRLLEDKCDHRSTLSPRLNFNFLLFFHSCPFLALSSYSYRQWVSDYVFGFWLCCFLGTDVTNNITVISSHIWWPIGWMSLFIWSCNYLCSKVEKREMKHI